MKKTLLTLASVMGLLLVGGCSEDVESEYRGGGTRHAIGFSNGCVDNPVLAKTRATTSLSEFHETMGVFGWENTADGSNKLFPNTKVTYKDPDWEYSPLKYWENVNTYDFYAYAPHSASVTINDSTRMISIPGIMLNGTAANDTDWMLARTPVAGRSGMLHETVEFVMNHLLAKFEVVAMLGTDIAKDNDITAVSISSFTIDKFVSKADFAQAATPALTEWTYDDTKDPYTLAMSAPTDLKTAADNSATLMKHIILPQTIDEDACISLKYSITSGGKTEPFVFTKPLKDVMATKSITQFDGNSCYTLTFTIGPSVIKFDADVTDWTDEEKTGTM